MHSFWINANELNFDVRHIHTDTGNVLHMMFYYVHACMQILMYIARLCVPFSIGFLADCLHTKNAAETRHQNTHIRFYSNFNTQTTSCVNIEWECSQPLWFYLPIWNGNIAWKPAKCAKFSAAHIAFIIHNEHCINTLSFISTTTDLPYEAYSVFLLFAGKRYFSYATRCHAMPMPFQTIVDSTYKYIHIHIHHWQRQ